MNYAARKLDARMAFVKSVIKKNGINLGTRDRAIVLVLVCAIIFNQELVDHPNER